MPIRKKYGTPSHPPGKPSQTVGSTPDPALTPKLYQDGTLEVRELKETSSDGTSYHLNPKTDKVQFQRSLDANTTVNYIPQNVDKVYETTVSFKDEIKEAFGVFRNDVKKFALKSLDRYKKCPKQLKKKIDSIQKNKKQFVFTERKGAHLWNQSYVDSTTFGPYNYAVELHVTKDIEFINDLIVIRTGSFENKYDKTAKAEVSLPSNKWSIAWVSPHQTLHYSGVGVYHLTGTLLSQHDISLTGYLSGITSFYRDYQVSNAGQSLALSSAHISIPKNQTLSSGLSYNVNYKDDIHGEEDDPQSDPLKQSFYYVYDEYTGKFNTGGWDGVIPSGAWFNIETWSTNPKYVGFDGEITVKPTGASDPTCDYSGTFSGTASDADYQLSVKKALKQAKKKFYRALNKSLITKGIKSKSSRTNRYERLLEKVAQNVFDGLSMIRNVQIAKVQGLEANPLGSPVYYDGTIKEYGGTDLGSDYDSSKTASEKSTGESTGTGSSGGSSY